ncbi:MAG: hypothetical protein GTO18_12955 [Anaerolineales bacterium]|nr:hypothetical protein [Anaerolineales bacterium]
MNKLSRKDLWTIVIIVLLAVLGVIAILYSTSLNPWVYDDSVGYIENAKNLIAGRGLGIYRASGVFRPLSYHPPFYSLVLSVPGLLKIDYLVASRYLNTFLFGASILLIGLSSYSLVRIPLYSIALCMFVLITPIFILNFTGVMSEPLFFTLGLLGLILLIFYLHNGKQSLLIMSAVSCGLALVTRYSGLVFVTTGALVLILLDRRQFKRRITKAFVYFLIGILPLSIWLVVQRLVYPTANPGVLNLTLSGLWQRLSPIRGALVNKIWNWLPFSKVIPQLSYRNTLILLALLTILLLLIIYLSVRRMKKGGDRDWHHTQILIFAFVFGIFTLIYIFVLSLSVAFVIHPAPAMDERILSPILFGGIISLFSFLFFVATSWSLKAYFQIMVFGLCALILIAYVPSSVEVITDLHTSSMGYTSKRWVESDVIQDVLELPQDIRIISSEPTAILFYAQRPAHTIPEISGATPVDEFYSFGDGTDNVQQAFRAEGAALVLFNDVYWQFYPLYGERTQDRLDAFTDGLKVHSEGWDGAIYFYRDEAE